MSQLFIELQSKLDKAAALSAALNLLQWDTETLAPEAASEQTAKIVGILSDEYLQTLLNPETKKLLEQLEGKEEYDRLTLDQKAILRQLRRNFDQMENIPPNEYAAFNELTTKSSLAWAKAREKNDFDAFAPMLEKVIEYKKTFASYGRKDNENLYNVLLRDYEPCMLVEDLDKFFDYLKKELVPLIKKVSEREKPDNDFVSKYYAPEKQKEFCKFITKYIGFEPSVGVIAESAHPFTTNLHNKDVRLTNHYNEHDLLGAIFSAIHEGGHAIYEMDISDDLTLTLAGAGASMAFHESQSRFYENYLGKSKEFWDPIYGKLLELYPEQLTDISLDQYMDAVNAVEPGLIRIDADELTYPMHIIVRYELEKMIFNDEITIDELPKAWNEKYKEYLGVEPDADGKGVLQDTHWAWGNFGYFPSYAVGSAIAAQLYYTMLDKFDLKEKLLNSDLAFIQNYLREQIHQYGMTYDMNELLERVTGETFNPTYYVRYLKEKFE